MGIAKNQFNNVLSSIFAVGNEIKLYTKTPTVGVETDGELLEGAGVEPYVIKADDFNIADGEVTSARHMMLYLYEVEGEGTSCDGFGVFGKNGDLLYFGDFHDPITLGYNDVPTIKMYNESKREGIKITMTSEEVSATTE